MAKKALSAEFMSHVAEVFRVLGDSSRLEILNALMAGPLNVTEVVRETGKGQANVSKHLGVLADAHLVSRTRRGSQVIYEVSDPFVFRLCDLVCGSVRARLTAQIRAHKALVKRS
jgi:DNA-binding transcriptional ArsR family regulator